MTNIFPTDFVEKVTPANADKILLADSADSNKIKYGQYSAFRGATGATGATGAAGSNGSNGTNGTSFVRRGAYAGGTAYAANDAVSYNGSSYICILASTGNLPTNGTYRETLAIKGNDGAGSGDMLLGTVQSVTALKTFDTTKLAVKGSSTGSTAIASANASGTDYTATLPAKTGTIAMTSDITGTNSGTNTGDNATNSQYSGLAASKADVAQTMYIGTTSTAINRSSAAQTLSGITLTTPDIGTPSAGTLTNCTGLPAAGVTGTALTASTGLSLSGGTMTGKIVKAGNTEVGATYTPASGSQTVALDCAVNNIHIVSGHNSGTAITFTVNNATSSQPFIVSILQGGTTLSTISGWFATVRRAGGSAPTLTATLNKRDTFGLIRTGADTYDGFIIGQNC